MLRVRFSPDGQANVYMDGHILVQNENYREMEYYEDANGDPQIAVKTDAGRITVTDELQGRFGGRINAYEKVDEMLSSLNDWATQFVQTSIPFIRLDLTKVVIRVWTSLLSIASLQRVPSL